MRQGQQVMPGPTTVTPPYGATSKVTGVSVVAVVCAAVCALLGVVGYARGLGGVKSLRP